MARTTKTSNTSTLEKLAVAIGGCGKTAAYCWGTIGKGLIGEGTVAADDYEIIIAGVGRLSLPMRARHVRQLRDIAKPAPYGER